MADIKGKNVLITGGAGFIGSHLTDTLLAAGAEKVVIVDNFFLGKDRNIAEAKANYPGRVIVYRDDARDLGTMKAVMRKPTMGKMIFSFWLTTRGAGILMRRSLSVVRRSMMGFWITGTRAM